MPRELIQSDRNVMMVKPVATGTRIAAGETVDQMLEKHLALHQ